MQCQYMRDWVISQGQATKRWCHKRRQRSLLRAWNISNISDLCTEKIQIRGTLGTQSVHMTDGRLVGRPTQTFNALLSTQWALVGTWALGTGYLDNALLLQIHPMLSDKCNDVLWSLSSNLSPTQCLLTTPFHCVIDGNTEKLFEDSRFVCEEIIKCSSL